ncbi:MAG: hypothetical protein GY854_32790 [Deltaproteobacteria bacterium]|nr:hypothetical protein [Deltaproteobacteria bacterium]
MIPFGAVFSGLAFGVGPSLGHFYSDNWRHGWITLSIRTVLVAGFATAAIGWFVGSLCDDEGVTCSAHPILPTLTILCSSGALFLAIFDIVTAPRAARRANMRRRERPTEVSVVPVVSPDATGRINWGLGLSGTF